jgi:hypothetical protein
MTSAPCKNGNARGGRGFFAFFYWPESLQELKSALDMHNAQALGTWMNGMNGVNGMTQA